MKKILIPVLAAIVLAALCAGCNGKKDWAARIDSQVIPMADFNARYDMYIELKRQQPDFKPMTADEERMLKRELLKNMIGEILIFKELKKEKFDGSKEMKDLFRQFLIQKYLEKKLLSEITVTPGEVDSFYRQNKDYFKGMDPEMAQQRIQYQLTLQKFEAKTSEIIEQLYGKYKIQQNPQALISVAMPSIGSAPSAAPGK